MTTEQWEYDIAWISAWQSQCCPPDDILLGTLTTELEQHLSCCRKCQDQRELFSRQDMDNLNTRLKDTISDSINVPLAPGQLWSLYPSLGGWGAKKRYYTPPIVLIIKYSRDDSSCFVAQTHDNEHFISQGDILLPNYQRLQAEAWNTYTLRTSDLNHYFGAVDSQIVKKIINEGDFDYEINDRSLLNLFRQLEIETGFYFSSQAVTSLRDQYNKQADIINLFDRQPTTEIQKAMKRSLFISPSDNIISMREYLLKSSPTEDLLQQAADSRNLTYCCGPFLFQNEQKQLSIQAVHCRHDQPDYDPADNSMIITGTFDPVPGSIHLDNTSIGWLLPDNQLIMADHFQFDQNKNSFKAIFSSIPNRQAAENGSFRFCLVDTGFTAHE